MERRGTKEMEERKREKFALRRVGSILDIGWEAFSPRCFARAKREEGATEYDVERQESLAPW